MLNAQLIDLARRCAPEAEEKRCLPERLVEELRSAGLLNLFIPSHLGGLGWSVAEGLECFEELAGADGSTGWVAMITSTTGISAAYLPEAGAGEIFGGGSVVGGVIAPKGVARRVEGGYVVTGRWPFVSASPHCGWLGGGAVVEGDPLLPSGRPDVRMMFWPAIEVEILDTWHVSGLRATSSHDMVVKDQFVPAHHSCSYLSGRPRLPERQFQFPLFGVLAVGIGAVCLGIARASIDQLTDLAGAKTPAWSARRLVDRPAVQESVARAEARLGAARSYLFSSVNEVWESSGEGEIDLAKRSRLRMAATLAATESAAVVDAMYSAGGGTSIYESSPLQRQFRDVHTATQHMMVAQPSWEMAGKALLGLEFDASTL